LKPLFPTINPYAVHTLPVDARHTLYIEESGNPDGIPVVVCHGGPGAGSNPGQRRFFDPSLYRVILFDQRGCGRSTPLGELQDNTTQDLIADIEKIRQHLSIDSWVVFGGSWGAALALLYAQAHPTSVKGLIVRSVLLARQRDFDWLFVNGANAVFRDAWENFVSLIPTSARQNLLKAYHEGLNGKDEILRIKYAKAWSLWHRHCASFQPLTNIEYERGSLRLAQIESHYFLNQCFIREDQILEETRHLRHLPTFIIHGRFDMITPYENAFFLKEALSSHAELRITHAGHSSSDAPMIDALITATTQMLDHFSLPGNSPRRA
jgi:proline iminopeptidase